MMTKRSHTACVALGVCALVTPLCLAQTGVVRVTHDDDDGIIQPGQVVRISVEVTWAPSTATFAGLRGSVLPTPAVGSSANMTSILPAGGLTNHGSPSQGGWVGMDFVITPAFGQWCYPWPNPGHNALIGPLLSYDWTAPSEPVGPVSINWIPDPTSPQLRLYPATASPGFVYAITTYLPATLTVIPAPTSAIGLAAGLGWLAAARRRARPASA